MKKICTIFFLLISSVTNAQSSSANLLELDPNIIAAANCNGALLLFLWLILKTAY